MSPAYDEGTVVEDPAVGWFDDLGWTPYDGNDEKVGTEDATFGRRTPSEVFLREPLRAAMEQLNPTLGPDALDQALGILTQGRSTLSLARANRQVYRLLKDGIPVTVRDETGQEVERRVDVIDWRHPFENDFRLVRQFRVAGEPHTRIPDLVGFVNGLPLVLLELKSQRRPVRDGYDDNLTTYRDEIPQLFWPNGLVILSNRTDAVVGSITAQWEHFGRWKKVESEDETPHVSLERTIRAVCHPERLLDLIENFVVYSEQEDGVQKMLAMYHQYHGVNEAVDALHHREDNDSRLGVFWHTQGSGKSVSMVFFSQKVQRILEGNWTFLVVTDRTDLDNQIYKTFARAGVLTEPEEQVRAQSGQDLRVKLREDHRVLFTLIQKFRTEGGEEYPQLSDRSDVIVMTDEAHRSQYDVFAGNMRAALPNAAFLGFTGTPLMAEQELTRQVFGDYVSVYDFQAAVEDEATVPLHYENRIPELQLTNEDFNEDMESLLDEIALDEAEERAVEQEFSRQYHLLTREDRLDTVGEDIVEHFMTRGFMGKAMVVSLDRPTAIHTYDKVTAHWEHYIDELKDQRTWTEDPTEISQLDDEIAYMEETDMAVVVSESPNEVEKLRKKGADIRPHRERMRSEDLDEKFKDPDDPLRIAFVCAKWTTGFDVKPCSTIYLDKPMRDHTLMQTIARANRVFRKGEDGPEKPNGIIVDYVGVFRNLQEALALYTTGEGNRAEEGQTPIRPKEDLLDALDEAIEEARAFCAEHDVDLMALRDASGSAFGGLVGDAVEKFLVSDDVKQELHAHARRVDRLYRAILPDPQAQEYGRTYYALTYVSEAIKALRERPDVSNVMQEVEDLLDESVAAEPYVIRDPGDESYETEDGIPRDEEGRIDLSAVDTDTLRERFETEPSRTLAERLRGTLETRIRQLAELNPERIDYKERLESMIERYNEGSYNQEQYFQRLLDLLDDLQEEEQRAVRENLSEEELALFDILHSTPAPDLSEDEREAVKAGARELLDTLKNEKLVIDWRKKQKARSAVRVAIEKVLDEHLPHSYETDVYDEKVEAVYEHVYDKYYGPEDNFYEMAA
jgi:type I restriction enzyme R subunit